MGRRDRHYDYSSSSSDSDSEDDRRSRKGRCDRRRRDKSSRSSRRKGKSRHRDRDRARTPEPPPRMPSPTRPKPPKIAMVLILGQGEVEFKLTEAQLLFDSPNDLTSTYYADNSGEVRTYRMPDRDAAIFQIIFRYMNREVVIPLRKSLIPKYLSYEQTEAKLAEEAKFYRLNKLMRMLPPPGGPVPTHAASAAPSVSGSERSLSDVRAPQMLPQVAGQYSTPPMQGMLMPPQGPPHAIAQAGPIRTLDPPMLPQQQYPPQQAIPMQQPQQALPTVQQPLPSGLATPVSSSRPPTSTSAPLSSRANSPMRLQPPPARRRPAKSESSGSATPRSRSMSRSGSRPPSMSMSSVRLASSGPPPTVFTYLFKPGGHGLGKNETPFPIVDFPDDEPMPRLFVKATAAEIKFSAFRNADDNELFELRYSIRILDEPATRALAYRIKDTTIKSIDSHLRLNGVVTDMECRDIPLRIKHSVASQPERKKGALSAAGNIIADDDGSFTSGFDELLELMTTKGYVKWPRIWQDAFTNLTAVDSLHQRVSLTSCEILLDLEFPEEAAAISEAVGGRGFELNTEDEEDLLVRNYRVNLHGIRMETRKMRRLREMDEMDPLHQNQTAGADAARPAQPRAGLAHSVIKLDRSEHYRPDKLAAYPETPRTYASRATDPRTPISEGLLTPRPPHHRGGRGGAHSRQPSYTSSMLSGTSSAVASASPHPRAGPGAPDSRRPSDAGRGGERAGTRQLDAPGPGDGDRGRGYPPPTPSTMGRSSQLSYGGTADGNETEYTDSLAPSGVSGYPDSLPVNRNRYRSSAPSLDASPSEYTRRPRSTASEEIKRRAMAKW